MYIYQRLFDFYIIFVKKISKYEVPLRFSIFSFDFINKINKILKTDKLKCFFYDFIFIINLWTQRALDVVPCIMEIPSFVRDTASTTISMSITLMWNSMIVTLMWKLLRKSENLKKLTLVFLKLHV
jgi:hypothetical protein